MVEQTHVIGRFLAHLNSSGKLKDFQGSIPVTSLEQITNGVNVVTQPDDSTMYLAERVVVQHRDGERISLGPQTRAYRVVYNFAKGGLVLVYEHSAPGTLPGTIWKSNVNNGQVYLI